MAYQVLENNEPIVNYLIADWKESIFDDYHEAQVYAYSWAYPLDIIDIRNLVENNPFVLGEEKDCSMSEFKIMMKIIEYKND